MFNVIAGKGDGKTELDDFAASGGSDAALRMYDGEGAKNIVALVKTDKNNMMCLG